MATELSASHIDTLTGIITGSHPKRAANRADALKRFQRVAAAAGIKKANAVLDLGLDDAKDAVAAALAEANSAEQTVQSEAPEAPTNAAELDLATKVEELVALATTDTVAAIFAAIDYGKAISGPAARTARKPRTEGPSKRDIAAALLRRPEGTTSREILAATGWPAVSVPAIAKASGLTLRQQKIGRLTQYYGVAA